MQSILAVLAISAASFLAVLPDKALAQIPERHQHLMPLSLQEVAAEGNKTGYDRDVMGHIYTRCTIIYSIMETMVVAAIPAESPEIIRAKAKEAKENFSNKSELMMKFGIRIIDIPQDQIIDLFEEMQAVWSTELANGAAQMVLKSEGGRAQTIAGQHFKQQLDFCNSMVSELIEEYAKTLN